MPLIVGAWIKTGCTEKKKAARSGLDFVVPGDRVELPTRGFSVPCSTD